MKNIDKLALILKLYHRAGIPVGFGKSAGIAHYHAYKKHVVLSKEYYQSKRATPKNIASLVSTLAHELGHAIDYHLKRWKATLNLMVYRSGEAVPIHEFQAFCREIPVIEIEADRFSRDLCKRIGIDPISLVYLEYLNKHGWTEFFDWVLEDYGFHVVRTIPVVHTPEVAGSRMTRSSIQEKRSKQQQRRRPYPRKRPLCAKSRA